MGEIKMVKMPKIRQYKDVVREVQNKITFIGLNDAGEPQYDRYAPLPKLDFKGSIKLHGTNMGIVYTWIAEEMDYTPHVQSKNNIITPTADNFGAATFVYSSKFENVTLLDALLDKLMAINLDYTPNVIAVYGEWCGGNIQDKIAINGLNKMFVIFAVKIDGVYLSNEILQTISVDEQRVYNILDFQTFDMTIDIANPQLSSNLLSDITLEVEKCCPVGKSFGKEGIGEGVVWKCVTEGYESSSYWFKVKGDEHAKGSGKVKTLAPVDVERHENIKALVESLVTERRLEQGFEHLVEMQLKVERPNIPKYIKWVIDDVVSEELDTIVENGFTVKEVAGKISEKARNAFFEKEKEEIGL